MGNSTHALPQPFMVFATQNPFESEGTFPLPEAQLDRFLMHSTVPYPDPKAEADVLRAHALGNLAGEASPQVFLQNTDSSPMEEATLVALIQCARQVPISDEILSAIRDLVRSSRPEDPQCPELLRDLIWYGASPRAGIALVSCARAFALISGDNAVQWKHVRRLALPVLRHRVRLTARARRERTDLDVIVADLVTRLEARSANLLQGIES